MPYIAWLVPSWFWMHLVFTVPWLFLLSGFCIIKETPRWLLTKRRFDELEELLLYAAKKNGKNMKLAASEIKHYIGYHSQMKHKENEDDVTVLDMLRTPGLRKNSIIMYYSCRYRPIIAYACPFWGYAANTNIKILDTLQNSFIRMIVKATRYKRNDDIPPYAANKNLCSLSATNQRAGSKLSPMPKFLPTFRPDEEPKPRLPHLLGLANHCHVTQQNVKHHFCYAQHRRFPDMGLGTV
ncbi:organic cation transporter protein [Trichonephila clavipes]|nr:organic cation transporter protein [Trichonephila clavipes]